MSIVMVRPRFHAGQPIRICWASEDFIFQKNHLRGLLFARLIELRRVAALGLVGRT